MHTHLTQSPKQIPLTVPAEHDADLPERELSHNLDFYHQANTELEPENFSQTFLHIEQEVIQLEHGGEHGQFVPTDIQTGATTPFIFPTQELENLETLPPNIQNMIVENMEAKPSVSPAPLALSTAQQESVNIPAIPALNVNQKTELIIDLNPKAVNDIAENLPLKVNPANVSSGSELLPSAMKTAKDLGFPAPTTNKTIKQGAINMATAIITPENITTISQTLPAANTAVSTRANTVHGLKNKPTLQPLTTNPIPHAEANLPHSSLANIGQVEALIGTAPIQNDPLINSERPATTNFASGQAAGQSQTIVTQISDTLLRQVSEAKSRLSGTLEKPNSITVQLTPAELGRVQIRFSFDGGDRVIANVVAENPDTANVLRQKSDILISQLKLEGFNNIDLDFTSKEDGGLKDFGANFDQNKHEDTRENILDIHSDAHREDIPQISHLQHKVSANYFQGLDIKI